MSTPAELGVDERAASKLQTLPEEMQQEVLARLAEGLALGNIHNPSGFVVSATVKASKVQASKPNAPPSVDAADGEVATALEALGVDADAIALLQRLPSSAQQEILDQLRELSSAGGVRNPSAWVARAANNYSKQLVRGGPLASQAQAATSFGALLTPELLGVDAPAAEVVQSLPGAVQQQLLAELKDGLAKGSIQNPSGWLVKAAKRRGAESSFGHALASSPEDFGVDARAAEMLQKLPLAVQAEILDLLAKGLAAGNVHNPSGFVVKKAMIARSGGYVALHGAMPGGMAAGRPAPY